MRSCLTYLLVTSKRYRPFFLGYKTCLIQLSDVNKSHCVLSIDVPYLITIEFIVKFHCVKPCQIILSYVLGNLNDIKLCFIYVNTWILFLCLDTCLEVEVGSWDPVHSITSLLVYYSQVALRFLIGTLYVNFQLLWQPTMELIKWVFNFHLLVLYSTIQ